MSGWQRAGLGPMARRQASPRNTHFLKDVPSETLPRAIRWSVVFRACAFGTGWARMPCRCSVWQECSSNVHGPDGDQHFGLVLACTVSLGFPAMPHISDTTLPWIVPLGLSAPETSRHSLSGA